MRERRHQSAAARAGGDVVVLTTVEECAGLRAAGATVAHVRVVMT